MLIGGTESVKLDFGPHIMFALSMPKWGQRQVVKTTLYAIVYVLRSAALIVLTLTLLAFVMLENAQACSGEKGYRVPLVAQSAAHFSSSAKQSAASSTIKATVENSSDRSDRCHDFAAIGSCCSACTSALIAGSWTAARDISISLRRDPAPPEASLRSTGFGTQFRPPRSFL